MVYHYAPVCALFCAQLVSMQTCFQPLQPVLRQVFFDRQCGNHIGHPFGFDSITMYMPMPPALLHKTFSCNRNPAWFLFSMPFLLSHTAPKKKHGGKPCFFYALYIFYRIMLFPSISSGCGKPITLSIVGAISASFPPVRSLHG